MAKHQAADRHPLRDRAAIRTTALAMIGLTLFVIAMIASYSGAFAKPTLRHMAVAVAGPQQVVDGIRGEESSAVTEVGDDAAARQQVYERKTDAAFVVGPTAEMKIYVAGGGGRSVATAAKANLAPTVEDVAPASAGDPSGTVEFYAMAVGGAVTWVAATFGSVASMTLTAFLVVIGNAAAAGPVGRPLLSSFYSTFTAIVPQGSGVSLLPSVSHFGGHGAQTPLVTLAIWGAAGCLLASAATASRMNYRAVYERCLSLAGRDRAVLRPGVLSPAD